MLSKRQLQNLIMSDFANGEDDNADYEYGLDDSDSEREAKPTVVLMGLKRLVLVLPVLVSIFVNFLRFFAKMNKTLLISRFYLLTLIGLLYWAC